MDRKVVEVSSLSLSFSLFLSLSLSLFLSLSLSFSLFLSLSLSFSDYLPTYLPIYLSIHPSIHPSMSLVLRRPRKMHLCRSSSNVPRPPSFLEMLQNPHVLLTFDKVHNPLRLPRETTSQRPKMARTCCIFHILTSKCALRHNGVHFFDISTSKSGPKLVCFVHFDFEMCFAPQRRALFRYLNFQKWSEGKVLLAFSLANVFRATTARTFSTSQLPKVLRTWGVFSFFTCKCASRHSGVHSFDISTSKSGPNVMLLALSLANVLLATTACTFSTSQLPKVVRSWCALYILTSKCASRHNGVQFFISHLARCLRTRRFSEPTFRPSGATNHWKNTVFRDFPTFSITCIFFLLTLSLLWSSLFYSSLLSDSFHLCFSSVHIVGSLTSKLPSIIGDWSDWPASPWVSEHPYPSSRNHDDPMAACWACRQGCKLLVMWVSAIMAVQYRDQSLRSFFFQNLRSAGFSMIKGQDWYLNHPLHSPHHHETQANHVYGARGTLSNNQRPFGLRQTS